MYSEKKECKFVCAQCGNCCTWSGYVIITDDDLDRIAAYLKMEVKTFIANFAKLTSSRKNLALIETENHECIFFDSETRKCKIYDVRPVQCRNFPIKWNFPNWQDECKGKFEA